MMALVLQDAGRFDDEYRCSGFGPKRAMDGAAALSFFAASREHMATDAMIQPQYEMSTPFGASTISSVSAHTSASSRSGEISPDWASQRQS
jgi:hypothetical protein